MIIDSPIVSSSQFISGSSTQIGNAVISGSLTVTGTINATITGSITSASYADFAQNSLSSSYALTASYISGSGSGTGFPFSGSAVITGSLIVTDQIESQIFITPQTLSRDITVPDYHNALILGPSSITGNITIGTGSNVIVIEDFTNLATTGSNTFIGNQIISGSVTTTTGFTGSLLGNASTATTASNSNTASFALTASNANLLDGKDSAAFANTSSNQFTGDQYISNTDNATSFISTAALYTDGGLRVAKDAYVSGTVYVTNLTVYGTASVQYTTSSQVNIGANIINLNTQTPSVRYGGMAVADSGSNAGITGSLLWDSEKNRWIYSNPSGSTYDGGLMISGPRNTTGLGNEQGTLNNVITKGQGGDHITSSQITDDGTTVSIPGNLTVTGSITGTITTASYVLNAVSSSYSATASYFITSSVTSASLAQTASYVLNAQTASYVTTAQTASYVLNAVSSSYALTASYISGSGAGVGFPFSGSAVITGSLLITNLTSSGVSYLVADSSGLITAQTASAAITSTQITYASAGQTSYAVSGGYTSGLVNVFVNGTKLNANEFTATNGTSITLLTGSMVNDVVEFQKYYPASGVTNNSLRQQNYFTASAGQTTFSVAYTPGLVDVFYNGSKLDNTEYTANNGTSIVFATASNAGDKIEIDVYSYQVGSFSGIGGSGVANQLAFYSTSNSISGSNNFTVSGSAIVITGSLLVSGSGTFTNIGPAIFSGSLTSTQGFTGSFSGTATSASFASTASSVNGLNQNVSITGSLTTTGQIVAQTLNVQQVTSSIVYSSGSNVFGNSLSNTQQMTGSLLVTGSSTILGNLGVGGAAGEKFAVAGPLGQQGFIRWTDATTTSAFLGITGSTAFIHANNNTLGLGANGSNNYSPTMVLNNGNVGIGTTSPTYALTITKGAGSGGNRVQLQPGTDYSFYQIDNSGGTVYIGTDNSTGTVFGQGNYSMNIYQSYSGDMNFFTAAALRMKITSAGKVLIGGTSSVISVNYAVQASSAGGGIVTNASGAGDASFYSTTTSIGWHFYAETNATKFYVLNNGDVRNANNSYGAISDASLKENIIDATPKLEDLLRVRVRNYNFIADENKEKQIGVIAQELEEIFPNMISEDRQMGKEETVKTVKYSVFVPMLIKAIQELEARVKELENK